MNIYVKAALYALVIMASGGAVIFAAVWVVATFGWWSVAIFGSMVLFFVIFISVLDELERKAREAKAKPGRETDY